ncbi:MAG: Gfo/Idh/MocA family oxidoreductase [Candidatus Brocadiia bacterium]
MTALRIGFIGTGKPRGTEGSTGFGMAYHHADGFLNLDDHCELVAAADIVEENVHAFADRYSVQGTYLDYHEMLGAEDLDVVSICTWPHLHEQMTVDCARAGVRAVHCEKPMADTWGGARHMASVCAQNDVQLTFNHMRRFSKVIRNAKALLDDGQIGELMRVEFGRHNLCDTGTHWFDTANYLAGQPTAEWVLAQVHYERKRLTFGAHQENQAISLWRYESGVFGLALTGGGEDIPRAHCRLMGTDGLIEIHPAGPDTPRLRIRRKGGAQWEAVDCEGETVHDTVNYNRVIAELSDCLESGRTPETGARNALQATELVFASWESARRRGRVDLPLDIEDNPLVAMVESGELTPEG